MNTPQTFHFEGLPVRDVLIDGEPWFVGKDVCACLDIEKHHQALENLSDDERGTYSVGTPRGEQQMICINEPGLYRLIFKSRKEEAERFKRWVCHEVLPQIRRSGAYGQRVSEDFGANGTVPVSAYIALLHDKIAMLEVQTKPKPKRITKARVSDKELAEMRDLAEKGWTKKDIALHMKRSEGTVNQLLRACPPAGTQKGGAA